MGKLKYLVLHCTATPEGREVTKADIIKWHTGPISEGGRGWRKPGYSGMFHLDGRFEFIVPFNGDDNVDAWEITNGVAGINSVSRHVVYVGGTEKGNVSKAKDTRTPEQLNAMAYFVKHFVKQHPDILVAGHNQFAAKACPSFDVPAWCKSIGIESKNIYNP